MIENRARDPFTPASPLRMCGIGGPWGWDRRSHYRFLTTLYTEHAEFLTKGDSKGQHNTMLDVLRSRKVDSRFSMMLQAHVTAEGSCCQPITALHPLIGWHGWRGWPPQKASPYQFQGTTQPPPFSASASLATYFSDISSSLGPLSYFN